MLAVESFINELMTSNCYLIYDDSTHKCIVIDPGSEKSEREISFIRQHNLSLDYIIVSHEHTDHNWGVNSLYDSFSGGKIVCTEVCQKWVNKANRAYFLFYYDDPDYLYQMKQADILIKSNDDILDWNGYSIRFFLTPGHSKGSMCVKIDNMLFTGDTIMPFKPYFNGRDSNEDDWEQSVNMIKNTIPQDTIIYPGHGNLMILKEWSICK